MNKRKIETYLNDIVNSRSDIRLCPKVFDILQSRLKESLDGRYRLFVLAASDFSALIKYQGVVYYIHYDYEKENYIIGECSYSI